MIRAGDVEAAGHGLGARSEIALHFAESVTGLFLLLWPAVPLVLLLGAPEAPERKEGNWIQTVPGKGRCMLFRLYGPGESWSDKTWRPGEIDLVES